MRTLSLLATIALLAPGAPAQEQGAAPERKPVTRSRELALERFDANRNGVLDPDEKERLRQDRKARVEAIKARIYARYDANRNGRLEPAEQRAFAADREKNKAFEGAATRLHDLNDDGRLDRRERERMTASRNAFLERLRVQALAIYDTNRNGVLDPDERAAMDARVRARRRR
jgi:hypothetical protein